MNNDGCCVFFFYLNYYCIQTPYTSYIYCIGSEGERDSSKQTQDRRRQQDPNRQFNQKSFTVTTKRYQRRRRREKEQTHVLPTHKITIDFRLTKKKASKTSVYQRTVV